MPRTDIKRYMLEKNWTMCSNYNNHARFYNQHYWENLYDHLMSIRIFTLIMNNIYSYELQKLIGKGPRP